MGIEIKSIIERKDRKMISIACISGVIIIALFVIFLGVMYSWSLIPVMRALWFSLVAIFLLIGFLTLPVLNLILVYTIADSHELVLSLTGMTADNFTITFVWLIAIVFIALNYIILGATVIFAILVYLDKDESIKGRILARFAITKPRKAKERKYKGES